MLGCGSANLTNISISRSVNDRFYGDCASSTFILNYHVGDFSIIGVGGNGDSTVNNFYPKFNKHLLAFNGEGMGIILGFETILLSLIHIDFIRKPRLHCGSIFATLGTVAYRKAQQFLGYTEGNLTPLSVAKR